MIAAALLVLQIVAQRYEFTPAHIELRKGQPVVLELTTKDRTHGFKIPDLGIDEKIEPGKVTRIELTPAKEGTFSFHCDVFCGGGHEDMTGEIVVKP